MGITPAFSRSKPGCDWVLASRKHEGAATIWTRLERIVIQKAVTYRSDTSDGPTAGAETVDPLEFLARVLVHIPDKGHVSTRYYGWYANRPRGIPFRDAGHGGVRSGAARDRAEASPRAHRGDPPVGGAAAVDLQGRPPRVPDVSRAHADHRLHYPTRR